MPLESQPGDRTHHQFTILSITIVSSCSRQVIFLPHKTWRFLLRDRSGGSLLQLSRFRFESTNQSELFEKSSIKNISFYLAVNVSHLNLLITQEV